MQGGDLPNERSSHSQPVPRLSGIGILAALVRESAGRRVTSGEVSMYGREWYRGLLTHALPRKLGFPKPKYG